MYFFSRFSNVPSRANWGSFLLLSPLSKFFIFPKIFKVQSFSIHAKHKQYICKMIISGKIGSKIMISYTIMKVYIWQSFNKKFFFQCQILPAESFEQGNFSGEGWRKTLIEILKKLPMCEMMRSVFFPYQKFLKRQVQKQPHDIPCFITIIDPQSYPWIWPFLLLLSAEKIFRKEIIQFSTRIFLFSWFCPRRADVVSAE